LTKDRLRFEKLLSFLQGASWALALAGGSYMFLLFLPFGFIISSIIALFCFLSGVFFVVVFELAQIQIEKLAELKQQTSLLEKISTHP
jgi:hypothetical protein